MRQIHSWIRIASREGLIAAIIVCAGATAFAAKPAAEMRRLTVTVYDYSGIEPHMLAYAEGVVSEVFYVAGIEIDWAEPEITTDSAGLHVNLLQADMAGPFSTSKEIVGFATPGSLAANAVYDRICEIARRRRLRCGLLLGYVMAHELGHLLLPAHSHSETGLMRASLDVKLAADKKLRFTGAQAALMLERLTTPPVLSTH